jgi:hypothetical protein
LKVLLDPSRRLREKEDNSWRMSSKPSSDEEMASGVGGLTKVALLSIIAILSAKLVLAGGGEGCDDGDMLLVGGRGEKVEGVLID